MKKQNVNNKLAFTKAAVTELNENSLQQINGGSSTGCICDAVNDLIDKLTKPIVDQILN